MNATVIIPFYRTLEQLAQSLPAARRSMPGAEIIVTADGAPHDCGTYVLYHFCNGLSFAIGAFIYFGSRLGLRLPGALPRSEWKR